MDGDARIGPIRPVLPSLRIHEVCLGFEISGLHSGDFDRPSLGGFLHWQVPPGASGERQPAGVGLQYFLPQ